MPGQLVAVLVIFAVAAALGALLCYWEPAAGRRRPRRSRIRRRIR